MDDVADCPITASLQCAGPVFQTDDAEQAHSYMSTVLTSHRLVKQDRAAPLAFWHRRADVSGVSIHRVHYGADVLLQVPPVDRFYLMQVTLTGRCTVWRAGQAFDIPSGHFAMVGGSAYAKRWSGGTEQLMLRLDPKLVEGALQSETGCDVVRAVAFDPTPMPLSMVPALGGLIALVCAESERGGWASTHPAASARVIGALTSLLLYGVPHDRRRLLDGPVSAAAPRYVRAAEDFITAYAAENLALDDIARAAGVSPRTLHVGFRRFRECTPIEHLRNVRLDRARQQLLRARHTGRTVTGVAEECGLRHLGRFARDYANRFGELPSSTAARSQ